MGFALNRAVFCRLMWNTWNTVLGRKPLVRKRRTFRGFVRVVRSGHVRGRAPGRHSRKPLDVVARCNGRDYASQRAVKHRYGRGDQAHHGHARCEQYVIEIVEPGGRQLLELADGQGEGQQHDQAEHQRYRGKAGDQLHPAIGAVVEVAVHPAHHANHGEHQRQRGGGGSHDGRAEIEAGATKRLYQQGRFG